MLPSRALQWATAAVGQAVVHTEPMTGGQANTCHLLTLEDGSKAVLRRWTSSEPRDVHEFSAARESLVLGVLDGVPDVLAADIDAESCDVPALLLSWIPGRTPDRFDGSALDQLAAALARVHRAPPPPGLPRFHPWAARHPLAVPPSSTRPADWQTVLDAVAAGPPPGPAETLLHGDFHPWNTLWADGQLLAIIDWPTASIGNPFADVARTTVMLRFLLPTSGAGEQFAQRYEHHTGLRLPAWWEARDLLDRLPENPLDSTVDLSVFDDCLADVCGRL